MEDYSTSVEEVLKNGFEDVSEEAEPGKNGLSIAALIIGVLSVLCCCFPCLNSVMAIVGLILAIIGKKKSDLPALSIWAIVMPIVGMITSVLGVLGYIVYFLICLEYV